VARFAVTISRAVTSTSLGVGSAEVPSGQSRRFRLLEFEFGSDAATLGTSSFRLEIWRSTSPGSTASGLPTPISMDDPNDLSPIIGKKELTANGTLGSSPLSTLAIAEQASFRWVAYPGGELIVPGVQFNGLHFLTPVCGNTPSVAIGLIVDGS
jgi:hypothetical protein